MSRLRFFLPLFILVFGFSMYQFNTGAEPLILYFFINFITFWVTLIGIGLYSGKHSLSSQSSKKTLNLLSLAKSLLFIQIAIFASSGLLGTSQSINLLFLVDVLVVAFIIFYIDKWIYNKYKVDADIPEDYRPEPFLEEWSHFFFGKNFLIHAAAIMLLGVFIDIYYMLTLILVAMVEIIYFYFKCKNKTQNKENEVED